MDYVDFIDDAGAVPLLLAPTAASVELLDAADALLLTGGDDYVAGLHDAAERPQDFVAISPRRESFDFELATRALTRRIPLLGICGGCQLLALATGGRVIGDLPTEHPSPIAHRRAGDGDPVVRHEIEWLVDDPRLPLPRGRFETNSHHHQAVAAVDAEWEVIAKADDGIVEAIRGPGDFQFGVQWHPEKDRGDAISRELIASLVRASQR